MQEKTSQNYTARLEALKHGQGWSDEQLADRIGLSRRMLYLIRTEKSAITKKAWYKLEQAEREAGIEVETPLDRACAGAARDGALHLSPADYAATSPQAARLIAEATPDLQRIADLFAQFSAQFTTITTKLDKLDARLERLESKKQPK